MRRREFIAGLGSTSAWPLAAFAQERSVPVIGYLSAATAATEEPFVNALRQGLSEGGYSESRNVELLFRHAEYQFARLPSLASDLVLRRVAVIAASGAAAAVAAKKATDTLPIVFETSSNPVTLGLVERLNRPGGNITGASPLIEAYFAKGIEMMHELLPGTSSIVVLRNPTNPIDVLQTGDAENAARTVRMRLTILNASNPEEIERAFAMLGPQQPCGLIVNSDRVFNGRIDQLVALAARYRVPTIYPSREAIRAGGLMTYGASFTVAMQIAGNYAARILKGEKPGDLPVQLATRIGLGLNLKTAKALGLTVPQTLLALADEVIE